MTGYPAVRGRTLRGLACCNAVHRPRCWGGGRVARHALPPLNAEGMALKGSSL